MTAGGHRCRGASPRMAWAAAVLAITASITVTRAAQFPGVLEQRPAELACRLAEDIFSPRCEGTLGKLLALAAAQTKALAQLSADIQKLEQQIAALEAAAGADRDR